jgi:hypothetical protein
MKEKKMKTELRKEQHLQTLYISYRPRALSAAAAATHDLPINNNYPSAMFVPVMAVLETKPSNLAICRV